MCQVIHRDPAKSNHLPVISALVVWSIQRPLRGPAQLLRIRVACRAFVPANKGGLIEHPPPPSSSAGPGVFSSPRLLNGGSPPPPPPPPPPSSFRTFYGWALFRAHSSSLHLDVLLKGLRWGPLTGGSGTSVSVVLRQGQQQLKRPYWLILIGVNHGCSWTLINPWKCDLYFWKISKKNFLFWMLYFS